MYRQRRERNTPQRRVILEELEKVCSHPTAAELYQIVRRRLPRISLGTVYRNLERLAAAGRIQKLAIAGCEARFDADLHRHYHVRCVGCGRVADVPSLGDEPVTADIKEASGYEILGHRLEFVGICPDCKPGRAGGNGRAPGHEEQ